MPKIQPIPKERRWFHSVPQLGIKGERPYQDWMEYLLPSQFEGHVLDVGTASGYFAFLAAQRGAERVRAIDVAGLDPDIKAQFMEVRERLGLENAVEWVEQSVYDVGSLWDMGLFLGVFYHLRHPALALDRLSEHCRVVWLETRFLDGPEPVLYYTAGKGEGWVEGDRDSPANWWYVPTLSALTLMCMDSGFDVGPLHIYEGRVMVRLESRNA